MAILNPNKRKQTQTSLFSGASGPAPVNLAPSYSFQGGHLVNGNAAPVVTPTGSSFVDPNLSYGANVVHAGAAASGGSTGGTTDEGVVIGNPNVDNSTFNNITESHSPTYAQFSGDGTGEGTVTPPVVTPPAETETPPTDTSGSEGDGTSTPTDATIDSYYDYLKTEMPEHLKGIYDDTIAAIDQANAKIIAEINAAKERGLVDANTSYQHNLSTYGAKNEALASMGLAGSGYSEYLDSQAYATQRAEAQGVNADALAAENNANATADAQKLEAKTALDENLLYYDNLAEQYLEGKWSNMLTGAGNGTYSKEQVENLAKYYGFSDEQIATLTGAVDSYEAEKAEGEAEAEKAKEEEEEENLAAISSENYQTISTNIKTDPDLYSEADIDKMVTDKLLTETDAALAKQLIKDTKTKLAKNDIDYYISSGDFNTLQSYLEKAYDGGNGIIDKNTYQDAYFRASLINCEGAASVSDALQIENDMLNLKNQGKLSESDYNAAVKYLYSNVGNTLDPSKYQTNYSKDPFGSAVKTSPKMTVTIDGTTYNISTDISGSTANFADKDTSKVLSAMVGNATTNGTLAEIDGTIYVYRTGFYNGSGWVKVDKYSWGTINGTSKGFYDAYEKACGYQAKPTKPKHAAET